MLCISLTTSLLCPCWILYPWCNYLVLLYRLSVGHANDTLHWVYLLACPNVHSLCEWSLWSLFIVIVHFWSSRALLLYSILLYFILLDRIVLTPYAFQGFCLQWSYCVVVFRKYLSYSSRASQILKLGVSEFCSTVPNSHVKSRVCFRVLSRNNQMERL